MAADIHVSVQAHCFDLAAETEQLTASASQGDSSELGAIASFVGLVRGSEPDDVQAALSKDRGALQALEIEHYPAMTQRFIETICQQASQRWPFLACRVVHRTGRLKVGEPIVMVLVASRHRNNGFAACEFIMDYLKTSAPFWKKALFEHGEQWVEAKRSDQQALDKWRSK